MAWIIVCIGVLIAAFALWDSIHDELPKELRLPRSPAEIFQVDSAPRQSGPSIGPSRWTVVADGVNFRASREFLDSIVADGAFYYPPKLHVSCYAGQLYAWMDTSIRAAELTDLPGTAAVSVNGGAPARWTMGEGLVLAAPEPAELIDALARSSLATFTLAFEEAPEQTLRLATDGMEGFKPLLEGCGVATVVPPTSGS